MFRHPEPSAVAAATRSLTRAVVVFIAVIIAITGVFTVTPEPARAATFTVSTTADAGAGSLRQAILDANLTAGVDTVDFSIAGTGPHTIALSAALPAVEEALTIDASNELIGSAPGVILDGTATIDADGLVIANPLGNGIVIGLQIVNFDGAGIRVDGSDAASIRGNRIGTADLGNGIGVAIENSFDVVVGGTDPADANVIAESDGDGVQIAASANSVSVSGNSIHDNGGLGIDIDPEGVGSGFGTPIITSATATSIEGTVDPIDDNLHVEVFANPVCDASGSGEGAVLLGSTTADAAGNWTIPAAGTNGTHLSATATLVDISETSTSEFGECFEVVDGLAAAGTWVGHKTGGSGASIPGDGDVLAAGSAAAGPAQFTYGAADPVPTSGVGASGSWTFSTTAAADATIQIPWRHTGFHAFAGVTVGLQAFVTGGGSVVTPQPLLAEGPQSCIPVPPDPGCPEPSGGFDYAGMVEFAVQAGDTYGFNLSGSNGDTNASLRGELVLGTELPTDCAGAQALYAAEDDGRYVILPSGGQRFSVHCADMDGAALDYLELHPQVTGAGFNFSSYAAGGASPGTTVTTAFTKLRFDPATLLVDIDDRAFSTSTGSLTHSSVSDPHPVSSMPYATAMACNNGAANGTANVNLFGTAFVVDDAWTPNGTVSSNFDSAIFSAGDTVVDIEGNGFCGWNHPDAAGPLYVFEPNPDRFVLQLAYATDAAQLETPTVFASVSRSGTTADIYGRVDGAANTPLEVEVHTSGSCSDGELTDPALLTTLDVTTDGEGYLLLEDLSGIESGDFVTITVTAPQSTDPSTCVRTTADNDYWPKALPLTGSSSLVASDVVEIEGRARWYRFPIVPDQQVTVALSSLPADYDLAVFRDIAEEFESQLVPEDEDDLARLSAEFSPSVFSPSVFSPSVFSPSVFSPDAYAPSVFSPSVFSPSVFSPSVFSPSVFSPSVFSPSVFSPSVFSPSVFSPSVFSPSVFSPSVFSPSVFSPEEVSQAFSSAQTRSLIGVSATPGTGDETVVVNTWNNTGFFYVRVAGRGGAFDADDLFTVSVAKTASTCEGVEDLSALLPSRDPEPPTLQADTGEPIETVILTDSSQLDLGDPDDAGSVAAALRALAAHERVNGVVVDVSGDDRVEPLKAQIAANGECPYAVNLLADEIKTIVDAHRVDNDIRYVTIIGDDTVIPFFRYPDQSRLGQESQYFPPTASDTTSDASLRRDFVLSQDAYGAGVSIDIRTNVFPIPDLAVGRLVETEAEIANMIGAFLDVDGTVVPASSLVTGYDFLTDAADAVVEQLQDGGTMVDELITDANVSPQQLEVPGLTDPRTWSWTADDLREAFLGERHDLVYLAGHFSAQSALAADYDTSVLTSELATSGVDLRNSLVFSGGCHSGYNLVDGHALATTSPLDWAQAFARAGATLVGGTGYQYGDTEFLEYSERLYRDFAQELRAGQEGTAISIGEALMHAKRTYLATTGDIRGIHEKAILEATVFGLPMFGVDMPDGRGAVPGTGGGTLDPTETLDGPAGDLGLATYDLDFVSQNTADSLALDVVESTGVTGSVTAQWFNGPSGVVTNPAEPAVPKHITSVSSNQSSQVLRGVGWRGGEYVEANDILPLTGAPTTELRGVHAPFVSPVFYPMMMWTPNYFGQLSGSGGTNLIVTPVQHRSDPETPGRTIRREFSDLDLRLFYSSNLTDAALSDAPTIVKVSSTPDGGDIVFRADVVGDPKAAIHEVWIVWTDGDAWEPLDLQQCTMEPPADTLPADCDGLDDSRVWAGRLSDAPPSVEYVAQAASGVGLVAFDDNRGQYYVASTTAAPEPVATALTLDAPPGGTYGATAIVNLDLTASGSPVSDAIVFLKVGGTDAVGITDAFGHASVPVSLNSTPATTQVTASFGGMPGYLPSNANAPFTIAKAPTDLGSLTPFLTTTEIGEGRAVTVLTADRDGTAQRLIDTNVTVTLSGATTQVLSVKTNYLGEVKLPVAVAQGSYTVTVEFAGDQTYEPTLESGTVAVVSFAFRAPVDNAPTINVVKAGITVPIKFSLGGNHGLGILDGAPKAVKYDCESGVPQDEVESTVTSNSGLIFTGGLYQYNWKTPKGKVGCYEFQLALDDGSTQVALFRLR